MDKYTNDEVLKATLEYFNGDELAAKVFVDKYCLQDNEGNLLELTPTDMHKRLAKEFARVEEAKYKTTELKPLSYEEIFENLDHFKYIVPQGSPMYGIGNTYQQVSLSNCFVLSSPVDSYGGILSTDEELVQMCKRRGGVGIDISNLRPASFAVNNAARTSTGIIPFMERYSNSIREVGQSGRRGALMLSISVHHPEILNFATIKNDLTKVTGANISVRLTDEFLKAVEEDKEYELRFPVDYKERGIEPKGTWMFSARKVWNEIIKNAHAMAEPGIMFWDNIIKESLPDRYKDFGFETVSSNPCVIGDTLVLTNLGWIKIKNLEKYKEKYDDIKIITRDESGVLFSSELEWVGITTENSKLMKVSFDNNEFLLVTPEHKLYLEDYSEKMVKDLNIGDIVIGSSLLKITDIEEIEHREDVYDLTANPNYNFYCIQNRTEIINQDYINDDKISKREFNDEYFENSILSVDCGEIPLSQQDSCRLLVVNLYSMVDNPFTTEAKFNFELFKEKVKIAQRLMDDIVDLEVEKLEEIIEKIYNDPEPQDIKLREIGLWSKVLENTKTGRRTGLGATGWGDMLAALGIGYGTTESIMVVETITEAFKLAAYESSMEMAKDLGAFKFWSPELEQNHPFLERIKESNLELYNNLMKHGRRNIALLTMAPTGTTSLLTQTSSGIEPVFMLSYTRRKKVLAPDVETYDFMDQNGDAWKEFTVYHHKLKQWMDITGKSNIEESPWFNYCAEDINWENRVKMQAGIQRHIDHSISSTINLPENVSVEEVKKIYETAWRSGCKGITVYRKNSRTGVLVESKKEEERSTQFTKHNAPKRPKELEAKVHHFKVGGEEFYVTIGFMDGDPYEIFVGKNNVDNPDIFIPRKITDGKIKKIRRGEYKLISGKKEFLISGDHFDESVEVINRLISISLRHGVSIDYIVHQLEKTEGYLNSYSKALSRTLKKYVIDGTKLSGEECPECGCDCLIREDGCVKCSGCGWSRC